MPNQLKDFPNIIGNDYLIQTAQLILRIQGKTIEHKNDFKNLYADLAVQINPMLINHCPAGKIDDLLEIAQQNPDFPERLGKLKKIIPKFDDLMKHFLTLYQEQTKHRALNNFS